ncbi:CBS domain-containing protein [Thalassotalea sp. 1_MG-2023]|uniref:CBS domain-containing protein n=1 Tax=Thalassotalea sp. 1_MG-2023 TaxID=3062680 RepID=UPI0026E18DB0|nr:CBS domain-containing protein [Thalassotalea sp. 1_MG-2023]MDO6428482.1 CBS domain-containing protein [Thalassotalea sp. 1_MG-2023]
MESIQVKDYMNYYPVTFTPDMVIEEASLRFLKTKQIGGPVVNDKNHLVGFLSESDIMRKMMESSYYSEHIADVAQLMRTEVLSVKPYDSVLELAQKMLGNKPKVYPVVDDDGHLLGTICRNDVLMAMDKHLRTKFK